MGGHGLDGICDHIKEKRHWVVAIVKGTEENKTLNNVSPLTARFFFVSSFLIISAVSGSCEQVKGRIYWAEEWYIMSPVQRHMTYLGYSKC